MAIQKVDIGIACAPTQLPAWWGAVMARLLEANEDPEIAIGAIRHIARAIPDHAKNRLIESKPNHEDQQKRRDSLTDSNRQEIMRGFLSGDAEWLWQLDDDTVPPPGALQQLLVARRDFIAGVYFLGGWPHNPIAYRRMPDGTYAAVLTYPTGTMIEVDSVGMGCTLIHRSVFEKIKAEHEVFCRPDGSLMPVHKSIISGEAYEFASEVPPMYMQDGVIHMPMRKQPEGDSRPWPFYALENGRTEDHFFCELAGNVGIKPWLDTNVVCDHLKPMPIGIEHHRQVKRQMRDQGVIDG